MVANSLCHLYNKSPWVRQVLYRAIMLRSRFPICHAWETRAEPPSVGSEPAYHLDPQFADLLAQGIAVQSQQLGGADLVPAGCGQGDGYERALDLADDTVVEPRRGQPFAIFREMLGQIAFDHGGERRLVVLGGRHGSLQLDQFGGHRVLMDRLVGIEHNKPPDEVLQLADIAGPGMALQPFDRGGFEALLLQTVRFRLAQEVAHEIRDVL